MLAARLNRTETSIISESMQAANDDLTLGHFGGGG